MAVPLRAAERARDLIQQICEAREVVIIRGAVSPDHIHLLVSARPILAPSKMVQYIKSRSNRLMQAEFPELRKRYWGQHMWARGYFCAAVGSVDEETLGGATHRVSGQESSSKEKRTECGWSP